MKIPLFDLDGTLLPSNNKVNRASYGYALQKVLDISASINEIQPHGMIDNQIFIELAKLHNIPEEETKKRLPEILKVKEKYFLEHEDEEKEFFIPLKGVHTLLETLYMKNIPIGTLTGNIELIGWRKLEKSGLRTFFAFGAFGNEAFKRVDLIKIAHEKVNKLTGKNVEYKDLVIVGDTPRDVKCAKEGGIESIAVATGPHAREELERTQAELVIGSLSEIEKILEFLDVN